MSAGTWFLRFCGALRARLTLRARSHSACASRDGTIFVIGLRSTLARTRGDGSRSGRWLRTGSSTFFRYHGYMERLVGALRGGPGVDELKASLVGQPTRLLQWRWGTVGHVCRALLRRQGALRQGYVAVACAQTSAALQAAAVAVDPGPAGARFWD